MRESNRIQEVRPPIVPVVERMISATPGTISMAQGMVAFAPPHQAIDALANFHDDPEAIVMVLSKAYLHLSKPWKKN